MAKVRSKSRRSRTRRSGRKMRGGMFQSASDWRSQSENFGTPSGAPAEWDRGFNPHNMGTGGVLMSDSPYAQPLPNVVGGYPELQHIKIIEDRGIIQIGSQEFRDAMAYAKQQAYLKSECLSIIPVYRNCYDIVTGLKYILNFDKITEFINREQMVDPADGQSIIDYIKLMYERSEELPHPDRYNDCQLISAPPGLS